MKKLLAAGLLVAVPMLGQAAGAAAGQGQQRVPASDAGSGCGLGSLMFEGNTGVGAHAVAMTTNGSLFNNTFGMSSGTLGCDPEIPVRYRGERVYISANMTRLAEDMSRGQGEILAGLAEMMGIADTDKAAFYRLTQRDFGRIYASESTTVDQVMAALLGSMKSDPSLAKYLG
ncbi:MAG: DUF3015 domain-containing protein [Methylococcaceae bacterium]|nr:DUF3015 domain-containing protein [Methylococcaceae bacterium]